MKTNILFILLVLIQSVVLAQDIPVTLKFQIERKEVPLDGSYKLYFIINGEKIYPQKNGNIIYVPEKVKNNHADLYFSYKKYKIIFYSINFYIDESREKFVWIINVDKRPFNNTDLVFIPQKNWWKVKWIFHLIRGNSEIPQFKYWFNIN